MLHRCQHVLPPPCTAHHLLLRPLPSPKQVSKTVLRRCMRVLPALRDKLIGAFAAFVVRIQEDHAQVIKDSLDLLLRCMFVLPSFGMLPHFSMFPLIACSCALAFSAAHAPNACASTAIHTLLCSLLRAWIGLAVSEWPPPAAGEAPQPLAAFDSLHHVEGTALVLLCSTDVEVGNGWVSNDFVAFMR